MVGRIDVNHIVPTAPAGTNDTRAASTAFVTAAIAAIPPPPVQTAVKTLFRAHMQVDQTVAVGANDKLVMNVADVDLPGGNYSTTNRRWTPPAGTVYITAQALATVFKATDTYAVRIVKNSNILNPVAQDVLKAAGSFMVGVCSLFDQANGTDFYEAYFINVGTVNVTINGFAGNTVWGGAQWLGP